ncbi:thymidine phosphorylase [Sphingomonas flavalba]|uniref:thymidine phosphorylase n=1 Tax=Sphingomonas flavalba TaxID=2559804 RepID=UPI00109DD7D5|nr:thymidine phosphorylase [Sphingomonas flavalba]
MQDIIRAKRDGRALDREQIDAVVVALADRSIALEHAAALAMAIYLNGMDARETAALTGAMARSGTVIDWRAEGLPGPALDKHSTGGVGDKVSFLLAPIIAACGGYVPMVAGRGLGHTGGTIDKLSAIPGYDAFCGSDRFRAVVREAGCAIVGQTPDIAPADGLLYAVRDATATIESTPLITASILSKKAAAGVQHLVMDIKTGSGAFVRDAVEAWVLGDAIVAAAAAMGMPAAALVTDMGSVLGTNAGNALEVSEAIAHLTGTARDPRLHTVTIALCSELLVMGGLAADPADAAARCEAALASGRAAEAFQRMVALHGGPADLVERPARHLAQAPVVRPVPAPDGVVQRVDARAIGEAIIGLGGGRRRITDAIDVSVGFSAVAPVGAPVGSGRPLALVHAADAAAVERAIAEFQNAVIVGDEAPRPAALIRSR